MLSLLTHSATTFTPRWWPICAMALMIVRLIGSVSRSRTKLPSILIMSTGRFFS